MADISKIKLPGDTTIYNLKDPIARNKAQEAIDLVGQVNNFSHYLGETSTAITDGATAGDISIGNITWTKSTTYSEENHTYDTGCIVTANSATSYTPDEFICNADGKWQKFGNMKGAFGALAYKDTAQSADNFVKTNTSTNITYATGVSSVTQPTITVTPTTAAVKVSVPADTWLTGVSYSKATKVSYSKATKVVYDKTTGATVTVDPSATFTGTIASAVTGVTGGTGTKNTATSLAFYTATGGQKIVTNVAINPSGTGLVEDVTVASVTGGAATVGSTTVYGLEGSTTSYMTTPETLNAVNATVLRAVSATTTVSAINASVGVADEILTFTAVTPLSSVTFSTYSVLSSTTTLVSGTQKTAKSYTVGKSGATTFTQPTVTLSVDEAGLTITSNTYKVSVPANTWIASVTGAAATKTDVSISVTGSAVTTSDVTLTPTPTEATITNTPTDATITNTATAATLAKNTATTLAIQAATGGYTVATGISSATATGGAVTLSTSTQKVLTGNTTGKVTVS